MSYQCKLNFKECKSTDDFFSEVKNVKKVLSHLSLKIIHDNIWALDVRASDSDELRMYKIDEWLRNLLYVTFLYYPNFNVMAYCSRGNVSGFSAVEFRSPCEYFYNLSAYPQKIEYFKAKVEQSCSADINDIKKLYIHNGGERENFDEDYARRWMCYHLIESELGIKKFLREVPQFEVPFSELLTTPIDDPLEWNNLKHYVNNLLKEKFKS